MMKTNIILWVLVPVLYFALGFVNYADAQQITHVRFELDMSHLINNGGLKVESETVGIRGDYPPLSWGNTYEAEDIDNNGLYKVNVPFSFNAESLTVSFKVKIEGSDQPDDGWQKGRNHTVTIHRGHKIRVKLAWEDEPPPPPQTITGRVDIIRDLQSDSLLSRTLYIYLPPGYATKKSKRYPVLYMHDGQALFDASQIGQEWKMDETAERLITNGKIEPLIIVGIGNTPNRISEYTPTSQRLGGMGKSAKNADDEKIKMGGKGGLYADFILHKVKPLIDKSYRTRPQREWTALGGSSLGGLITLYIGLEHPDVFSELLVVSPSVWWDERFILQKVEALSKSTHQQIWLDIGTLEGEEAVENVELLYDKLLQKGWDQSDIKLVIEKDAGHNERAWAKRVPGMLRFLFADK